MKLKTIPILVLMFLLTGCSSSTVLSNSWDFVKQLFTGGSSYEDAGFIVFILYFIMLFAIFYEVLQKLPVFSTNGKVSQGGKAFAIALSLLSSVALFVRGGHETVKSLVVPFGIWAGVVIAAGVAYVTYRVVKESEFAENNKVLLPVAVAATVAMMFIGYFFSEGTYLAYGFVVLIIIIIVALIFQFFAWRDATEGDRRAKQEEDAQWYQDQAAYKKRRRTMSGIKSWVIKAMQEADNLAHNISGGNIRAAQTNGRQLLVELRKAKRQLRNTHFEDDPNAERINNLHLWITAAIDQYTNQLGPTFEGAPANANLSPQTIHDIRTLAQNIRNHLATVLANINRFAGNTNFKAP